MRMATAVVSDPAMLECVSLIEEEFGNRLA